MFVHGEQEQKSVLQAKTKNQAINKNSEILMLRGEFDATNLCNTHWILRSMGKNTFACKLVSIKIEYNCTICSLTASTLFIFTITR